jgi:hypothetical protein
MFVSPQDHARPPTRALGDLNRQSVGAVQFAAARLPRSCAAQLPPFGGHRWWRVCAKWPLNRYRWIAHNASFGFLDIAEPTLGRIHFLDRF